MRGVDEVVGEWLCHVLIDCLVFWINSRVVFATEKAMCLNGGGRERERKREVVREGKITTFVASKYDKQLGLIKYLRNPARESRLRLAAKSFGLIIVSRILL